MGHEPAGNKCMVNYWHVRTAGETVDAPFSVSGGIVPERNWRGYTAVYNCALRDGRRQVETTPYGTAAKENEKFPVRALQGPVLCGDAQQ
jgi:hypothetical protein